MDAALASLHEALDIYTHLGDRELIGTSFAELTDALIWIGRFNEAHDAARRGLDYLGADVSANRAHLLAVLGQALAVAGDYRSANEALREALSIATKLADPKLEARVLGARLIANLHFFRLKEAASDGLLSERLGGSESSPWQRALQLRVLHQALLTLGRLDEAIRIAEVLEPLAAKIGQAYSIALCLSTRTWLEFVRDLSLPKLEVGFQEVSKSEMKVRFPFWDVLSEVQLNVLDFIRGNWAGALYRMLIPLHVSTRGRTQSRAWGREFFFDSSHTPAIATTPWYYLKSIASACPLAVAKTSEARGGC